MKKHTSNEEEPKLNDGIARLYPLQEKHQSIIQMKKTFKEKEDSGNSQMGLQNKKEVI